MRDRRSAPVSLVGRVATLEQAGASPAWGSITGTLSNQTDLQSALDGKAASSHTHSAADITSGTLAVGRGGTGTNTSTGTGSVVLSASPTLTGTLNAAAISASGAITASSFGGITSANLVDKSASESISGLWTFTNASGIQLVNSNTRIDQGAGNSLRVTTNSGYGEFGPNNTSWCHMNTDRANFYMNKGLHINGVPKRYTQGAIPWYASSSDASGKITVSTTAPTSPARGDIWFDTS